MTSLPSGPRGAIRINLQVMRDPIGSVLRWRQKYGDPMTLPDMNGKPFLIKVGKLQSSHLRIDDDKTRRALSGGGDVSLKPVLEIPTAGRKVRKRPAGLHDKQGMHDFFASYLACPRATALHQELYSAVLDWAAANNLASLTDFRESTGIASLLSVARKACSMPSLLPTYSILLRRAVLVLKVA